MVLPAYERLTQMANGYFAAADYSALDFHFPVKGSISSGKRVATNSSAQGESVLGFCTNKPASGKPADVALNGSIVRAKAGAAITVGAKLTPSGANGKIETAASGDHVCGIALQTADADGDIIEILVAVGGAPLA